MSSTYTPRRSTKDSRPSRTRGAPSEPGLGANADVAVTTVYSSSRSNSRVTW